METNHVEGGWRNHRAKPSKEIERLEDQRVSAVAPLFFHGVAQPAVALLLQAILSDGRPAEIATDSLDAIAVAAKQA